MEKKNSSKRYDWNKLKKEFLSSKFQTVQEWRKARKGQEKGKLDWNFNKQTKGRAEEKAKLKAKALNEAKEEIKKEMKELYKPSLEELAEMHQIVMQLIYAKLEKMLEEWGSMQDLAKIWEILKIEKGEPTKYEKSDQTLNHSFTWIEIGDVAQENTTT